MEMIDNPMQVDRKSQRVKSFIDKNSYGINKLDDPLQKSVQAFTGDKLNPWYYEMQELGFHYRITEIQCALALSQLKKLNHFIERRQYLAKRYDQLFQNFKKPFLRYFLKIDCYYCQK